MGFDIVLTIVTVLCVCLSLGSTLLGTPRGQGNSRVQRHAGHGGSVHGQGPLVVTSARAATGDVVVTGEILPETRLVLKI